MTNKEITIYDIAKALNLSASTVSRALNDHKNINSKTRGKVQQYAQEQGYQSNTFATNLRTNETKTLGVIVPKLDSKFVSTCLAGAEKVASEKGYTLLIGQSLEEVSKEISIAKTFYRKRVDGLMVSLTAHTKNLSHFSSFLTKGIPLVFFDRVPDDSVAASYMIDNLDAAYKATKHLLELGAKCLVHLTLDSENLVYKQRKMGFDRALNESQSSHCGETLYLNSLDFEAGKEAAHLITQKKSIPDAIFAANDQTAVGCILELQQLGFKIPETIKVVGFNNDLVCSIVSPPLTSVNYPAFDLGTMVANHLIEHILGNNNINQTHKIVLKSELVVRQSTLKIV